MIETRPPVDSSQRLRALDVTSSFIVQAPAGSGKTELLIQRILSLLATVRSPEEVLSITFTRKAAAEMRKRLLEALEQAVDQPAPAKEHAALTWSLARDVLARDNECGWQLLANPTRLQVMTIDSFSAALVRRMPYLARFGEPPTIADVPIELYRQAAERLLTRLETGEEGQVAIERLLVHLDNRVPLLRDLLVAMLARRDQWLRHLERTAGSAARPALEGALQAYVGSVLQELHARFDPALLAELVILGSWAADNLATEGGDNPLAALCGGNLNPSSAPAELPFWLALAQLLLTADGAVRKAVNKSNGFPAGTDSEVRSMKSRMCAALEKVQGDAELIRLIAGLRKLPAIAYADAQWQVLCALIELLPLAERELRETFRALGQIDFAEVARGALAALGDDLAPGELLLHLDSRLQHILVDEFQDTSRGQYELLSRLTSGWERGDGRTLFLVGDPMQSIYRFREAEVGLFLRVRARGLENVRLEPVALQANFRSHAGLVNWCNEAFAQLFPGVEDDLRGAVPFAAASAVRPALPGQAVTFTCYSGRDDTAEAARTVELVRESYEENPGGSVAILVRSRNHLAGIIPALRAANLTWQAQEIDPLSDRAVIRDLLALTRALLHPADRIAWLAVLRAPWCGLRLDDLLRLCGDHAGITVWECLTGVAGQAQLFNLLSEDGQARLDRILPVLQKALFNKGRVTLRRLVETAWLGLGAPAVLNVADLNDAEEFFSLLEDLDEGGDLLQFSVLEERLSQLYAAPDPAATETLQLMTIHKAKGLEFDTVILPGLGRTVRPSERSLLVWQELPDPTRGEDGLMLAPLPASTSDEHDPSYRAIVDIHAEKERLETLRLFYVATTRARNRLHLLGHAPMNSKGELVPVSGSLLKAVWPILGPAASSRCIDTPLTAATAPPVPGVLLRRIPLDWAAPALAPALEISLPVSSRASDLAHLAAGGRELTLRTEEGRIVGTQIHQWLERIACDGLAVWPVEKLEELRPLLVDSLISGGVPRTRSVDCIERSLAVLATTLRSQRGRWILGNHAQAASELALTGMVDGVRVSAVIDRTFIDAEGVRWVIDYKTMEPGEGMSLESFLAEETGRYSAQLQTYMKLMNTLEPERSVRGALYFPALDAWSEVASSSRVLPD